MSLINTLIEVKNLIFLSSVLSCLVSCSNVSFVNSQPEGVEDLNELPKKLQGVYTIEHKDTFFVTANTIGEDTLGKTLFVKEKDGFFYFNFFEDNLYELTACRIVKYQDYEKIEVFYPIISDDNKYMLNILSVETRYNHKEYILDNVNEAQLNKILLKDDTNLLKIK